MHQDDSRQLRLFEEWRPVARYEGWYEVSNLGRVKRIAGGRGARRGRILRPGASAILLYPRVNLLKESERKHVYIHHLVATAFIGPVPEGKEINHIDGDKSNPRVENLEYVTPGENNLHAFRTGLKKATIQIGERNPAAKLTEEDVMMIRRSNAKSLYLAREFGVTASSIRKARRGATWSHLE